jgi:hypothetical protein
MTRRALSELRPREGKNVDFTASRHAPSFTGV